MRKRYSRYCAAGSASIQQDGMSQFVSKLSREASGDHFSFRTFALRKRRFTLGAGGLASPGEWACASGFSRCQ
jgi:hypothetical protein